MIARKPDVTPAFKIGDLFPSLASEKYLWCLHCLRVFSTQEWNRTGCCPNAECDGSPLDAWAWSDIVRDHGWPDVPIEGQEYSPYPDNLDAQGFPRSIS